MIDIKKLQKEREYNGIEQECDNRYVVSQDIWCEKEIEFLVDKETGAELLKKREYRYLWDICHKDIFYQVQIETLSWFNVAFLLHKETLVEYFREKGYNCIATNIDEKWIHVTKWGLNYRVIIDFETMELKGIKKFYGLT